MAEIPTKPVTLALRLDEGETLCLMLLIGVAHNPMFHAPPVKSDALAAHNAILARYEKIGKPVGKTGQFTVTKTAEQMTEADVRYLQARYKEAMWPAGQTRAAEALGGLLDVLAPRFADVEKAKEKARKTA